MPSLKVLYTNTDQFLNKRDDLCMRITGNEPDVIILTETIPKAQTLPIAPAMLTISSYTLYTNFDCNLSSLGASGLRGICIYVSHRLQATQVSFPATTFQEQLWLRLRLKNSDCLLIGCIYRSPSREAVQSTEELCDLLRHVCATGPSHLLITGDFNMPIIDWDSRYSPAPVGHHSHTFIDTLNDCFLFQHVRQPTRYRHGETPSVLDLVLSIEEGMVKNLRYSAGLAASDHVSIEFELACYSETCKEPDNKLDFSRANFKLLNNMLQNTDWSRFLELDFSGCYALFKSTIQECIAVAIPFSRPPSKKKNIYINRRALQLRKKERDSLETIYLVKEPGRLCKVHSLQEQAALIHKKPSP